MKNKIEIELGYGELKLENNILFFIPNNFDKIVNYPTIKSKGVLKIIFIESETSIKNNEKLVKEN